MTPLTPQAFYIPLDVIESTNHNEVLATYALMEELDIAKGPYPRFDIVLPYQIIGVIDPVGNRLMALNEGERFVLMIENEHAISACVLFPGGRPPYYFADGFDLRVAIDYVQLLIVLLATKNTVTETKHNKALSLGIGKRDRKHEYVTTITIGAVTEVEPSADPSTATGRRLRPHLRRGHIRRQHFGPNREWIKKIFIAPVFVNSTDEVKNTLRTRYNVTKHHEEQQHVSHSDTE